MNLINRLRDFFHKGPALRNKPGGLAYIRFTSDSGSGEAVLNGCIVTTVSVNSAGYWNMEPPQSYVATCWAADRLGKVKPPGTRITVAIHDSCLIPIPSIGDDECTQEKEFQPKVPEGGRVVA